MANNLTAVIGADTSGFTRSINDARAVLNRYTQEARGASSAISRSTSVTDSQVASYQRVVKALDKVQSGTLTTTQAEKTLKAQIKELKIQWANLTEEAKRSDFGKSISDSLASAERHLQQVKEQIRQTNQELSELSQSSGEFDLGSIGASINSLKSGDISGFVTQLQALKNIQLGSVVSSIGSIGASIGVALGPVTALVGGIAALGYTIGESISSVSEFETHLDGLQSLTGLGDDAMKSVSEGAIEMSKGFKASASDIVDSMKLIGSQAPELLKNQDALMKVTEAANVLAEAAGIEVVDAAKGITTVMNQMNAKASEATDIINVLAASSQQGSADVAYLNTAFEKSGTAAKSAGMTYTQLASAIETIAPKFSSADVAGSTLNSTLLALSVQANDNFKPAIVGMDKALENLAQSEMTDAKMKDLVGASNIAMLKTLIEGRDTFKGFESSLSGTNTAYEQMAINTDNLDGTIGALKSNWEAFLLTLGESAIIQECITYLQQVVSTLTEVIDYVSSAIKELEGLDSGISFVKILGATWKVTLAIIKVACEIIEIAIAAIVKIITELGDVVRNVWGRIKSTLKDVGFFEPIRNACRSVITWFTNMVQKLQNVWKQFKKWLGLNVAETKISVDNEVGNKVDSGHTSTSGTSSGSKPSGSKTSGKKTSTKTTFKGNNNVHYKEGSLGKIEEDISKKQAELKIAISDKDRKRIQGEINDLTKKKEAIELSLKVKPDEGSLQAIEDAISQKQKELKFAIDDTSREKVQKQIDELVGEKKNIELKLKPVVDDKAIEGLEEKISEHKDKKKPTPSGDKVEKAKSNADVLKEELEFQKSLVKSYKEQYKAIQDKVKVGGKLNNNEDKLVSIYEDARKKVDALSKSYENAATNAEKLQKKSNLNKKLYSGIKGTISTIGSLNDSVVGVTNTWQNLAQNWGDMSTFQKVTSSISAVVSTISEAISAYESINDIIKLFGEISEATAAKKVAADSAEMASNSAKTATDTANTQVEIANDQASMASDVGKLGVEQASAIAGATKSGASLPFPANIAAIAAGIAAVVAGFAMVFSCFADGGIVGGQTTIGDYNLCRLNKGEMVMNGTQQKRLFNIINGNANVSGNGITSGNVKFEIKGSTLVGVLKNHNSKMNKIG